MLTDALRQVIEYLEQLDPNTQDLFAAYIQQKLPISPGWQLNEPLLATIPYSRDYPDMRGQTILVYQSFLTTPQQHIWRNDQHGVANEPGSPAGGWVRWSDRCGT